MRETGTRRSIVLATMLLLSGPVAAVASPNHGPAVGGSPFTGPTHAHASSLEINPAALTRGALGWHLYLGGTLRADQVGVSRQLIDPATGALVPGPKVSGTALTPTAFIAGYRVLGAGAVGASVGVPSADVSIADKPELGYHVSAATERRLAVNLGGALRMPIRRAFLGVGLSLVRTSRTLSFLRDTALDSGSDPDRGITSDCAGSPCGFENAAAAETWTLDVNSSSLVSTQSLGVTVGLLFLLGNLDDPWLVGLSVSSAPGLRSPVSLIGTATIDRAPRDGGQQVVGQAEILEMPTQVAWLAIRGLLVGNYELVGGLRYENTGRDRGLDLRTFGAALTEADVPERILRFRGYDDVYTVEAGLEQRDIGARLRGGARLRYESGRVDGEELTPRDILGQNLGVDVGAQLRLGQRIVIELTYGSRYFPSVDSAPGVFDPAAHVACLDSGFAYTECAASREGRGAPTAAGHYSRWTHALRLGLRYDFL